ncbi:MAG: ABC transporter permease [Nanoarchaeota archaeon]|nr:ABC transporter permease [Nanoarchaeota archaeon]
MRKRRLRAWLTMLGIIIGIAAVVSLISLGDGLRTAITGQFGSLSTDKLTIQNSGTGFGPPGSTTVKKLTSHDLNLINKVNGVEYAVGRLIRIIKVEYNKAVDFYYVTSIPNNQKQIDLIYSSQNLEAEQGKLLNAEETGVVIGSEIAKGDAFDKEINIGTTLNIQEKNFKVIGILKPSSSIPINNLILMSEKDLKEILNIGDEYDLIVAQINQNQIEQVAASIENKLRKDRDEKLGEEDFSVQTPLQAVSSVNTILNIINLIVTGIAAISLIIGGIGIANTMYTSVLERKKEIGIMKAVGAKNSDILLVFMIESGLLGLIGGIIGALVGMGMAFLVSSGANASFGGDIISVSVNYSLLLGAVAFSFAVGLLSGLAPAYQASKLKPVDALRG